MMDFSKVKPTNTQRAKKVDKGAVAVKDPYDLGPVLVKFKYVDTELAKMKAAADALIVKDDATLNIAVSFAGQAKRLFNQIEKERKDVIEEPRKFFTAVNNFCKKFTPKLSDIENSLKRKIGSYKFSQELERNKKDKAQKEALEELQLTINKQAEEAGVEAPQIPAMAPQPRVDMVSRSDDGTAAFIKRPWVYEVTDEAIIPREYCIPNPKLIKDAIKSGIREIPGLRIYQDIDVNLRT